MNPTRPRVLVYGDVNMNLIDGSAVWVQATAQAFARVGASVSVLLKAPVEADRLLAPLVDEGIDIVRPFEDGLVVSSAEQLSPREAARLIERMDHSQAFDVVVLRGYALVRAVVDSVPALHGRLWTYLTDIPQSPLLSRPSDRERLELIARASRWVLCQTEELRSFLESYVTGLNRKAVVFPPIVPDPPRIRDDMPVGPDSPLRLAYAGKFAPLWRTLEMTQLPRHLARRGVSVELHCIGDKIHRDHTNSDFADQMYHALRDSDGVRWHGGRPRLEAMEIVAGCDIGMSWRAPEMSQNLELSTKVLEYGAVGLAVLLNYSRAHAELLGNDYPLFVETEGDVIDVLAALPHEPAVYAEARRRCIEASQGFNLTRAADRVRELMARALPPRRSASTPLRVGIAGHDLKFMRPIIDGLSRATEVEVRVDEWPEINRHDDRSSHELIDWADVVVCEWCGPNAAWFSERRRPKQRLAIRLHRFELYRPYPQRVRLENVDRVVCVNDHYRALVEEKLGWPVDRLVTIGNAVDVQWFDRPKYEHAPFHLGMIGAAPSRKRLDLALDVIEKLRADDPRFMLFVKTKMPWDYPWIWREESERNYYGDVLARIQTSVLLRGGVVFDGFGSDVAAWLRKIGWVISTSDDESFHLAPAEGMASGAVPLVLHWPGAETVYSKEWIAESTEELALRVQECMRRDEWKALRSDARSEIERYDVNVICRAWAELLRAL